MEYRCNECGKTFDKFRTVIDKCGFSTPPYRKIESCPYCGEFDDIVVRIFTCDICGKEIFRGDIYYQLVETGERICSDCINEKKA